jgi:hypothetical protein
LFRIQRPLAKRPRLLVQRGAQLAHLAGRHAGDAEALEHRFDLAR